MSVIGKFALYSLATTIAFSAGSVFAGEPIQLKYKEYSLTSPEASAYWSDVKDGAQSYGPVPPIVYVAKVKQGDREISISVLYASNLCSINKCPLRVFEGDQMIAAEPVCDAIATHTVSDSLRLLNACDQLIPINLK